MPESLDVRTLQGNEAVLSGHGLSPKGPLVRSFLVGELTRSGNVISFATEVEMALSQGLQSGVVNQSTQPMYRADSRNRDDGDCRASVRAAPAARAVVQNDEVAGEVDPCHCTPPTLAHQFEMSRPPSAASRVTRRWEVKRVWHQPQSRQTGETKRVRPRLSTSSVGWPRAQ